MLLQKGWFKKNGRMVVFGFGIFGLRIFFRVLGLGFRVFGVIIGFSG